MDQAFAPNRSGCPSDGTAAREQRQFPEQVSRFGSKTVRCSVSGGRKFIRHDEDNHWVMRNTKDVTDGFNQAHLHRQTRDFASHMAVMNHLSHSIPKLFPLWLSNEMKAYLSRVPS